MAIRLAGIDEAGLGPLLGPLTTALAVFRAPPRLDPDDYAADFFAAFAPALTANARATRAAAASTPPLPVADSKAVYNAGGVAALTRTVRAFAALAALPGPRDALLAALGAADAVASLNETPWHADAGGASGGRFFPESGDAAAERAMMRAAAARAESAGWAFAGFGARVTTPAMLNAAFAAGLNKHVASMRETGRLLARAVADADAAGEALRATVDLQGGRRKYAPALIL